MRTEWTPISKQDLPIKIFEGFKAIADNAWVWYSNGDILAKVYNYDTDKGQDNTPTSYFWYNSTTNAMLTGDAVATEIVEDETINKIVKREMYHTDTTTGEYKKIYISKLFDEDGGLLDTITTTVDDAGTTTEFTVTGTVTDKPIEVITGSWTATVTDTATDLNSLVTIPANTKSARVNIQVANDVKTSLDVDPVVWNNGNWELHKQGETLILVNKTEVDKFKIIAFDNIKDAKVFITYSNLEK